MVILLKHYPDTLNPFPQLRELYVWLPWIDCCSTYPSNTFSFIARAPLQSIQICDFTGRYVLQCIEAAASCEQLRELKLLGEPCNLSPYVTEAMSNAARSLHCLQSLWAAELEPSALAHIAQLPRLEDLRFVLDGTDYHELFFPRSSGPAFFPSLIFLHVQALSPNSEAIPRFLDILNRLDVRLRTLRIYFGLVDYGFDDYDPDWPPINDPDWSTQVNSGLSPKYIDRVTASIAAFPGLQDLDMATAKVHQSSEHLHFDDHTLSPLLRLSSLEKLDLRDMNVDLSRDASREMALKWPSTTVILKESRVTKA